MGTKISHQQTTPVLFSRGRKDHFKLFLGENELESATQYRYLGVIFDNKLTCRPHLQDVALRCRKKLNILKVLAHSKLIYMTFYPFTSINTIHHGLYACEAYDSASDSVKNILNSIQYEALRIFSRSKRREMLFIRLRKRVDYQITP